MLKNTAVLASVVCSLCTVVMAGAEERATKHEAEVMVKKAIGSYRTDGAKLFTEITARSKKYINRDLYLVAYDMTGSCVAHGQNTKQVGKQLIGMKDPDGKAFIRERVELARSRASFWQEYKFTDPLTRQVLPKLVYCEKADDRIIICGGIYRE